MSKLSDKKDVSPKCWNEWISKNAVANAGVVVVNSSKEILILKRKEGCNKNYWELPSGGIKKDEKPQDAAIRELKEETGKSALKIKRFNFSGKYSSNRVKTSFEDNSSEISI